MTKRLLIAAGLVAISQLSVIGLEKEPKSADLPAIGAATLPKSVGDYVGEDEPIEDRVKTVTQADAMLNRVFRNKLGDAVYVTVGIWTQYELGIPHCPEECYPSAGWETVSHDVKTVQSPEGKPVEVKQLVFQRATSRIAVTYWAHLGNEIIHDQEDVRRMRQRLRKTHGKLPPLVKVMLQTDARDLAQGESRLSRFVTAMMPCTAAVK
jgi:EpsI family protein